MLQCCAVTFIEKLNADSLSVRPEDFERYMSGAAVPHDPAHIVTTCEGLRLMRENLSALTELRTRQERLMAEALQLQQDMVDFCSGINDQVQAVLARAPLDLRPRRAAANLDDEPCPSDADRLPPPLQPQVVVPMTGSTMSRSLSDLFNNGTKTISCTNAASVLQPMDTNEEANDEPNEAEDAGTRASQAEAEVGRRLSDVEDIGEKRDALSAVVADGVTEVAATVGDDESGLSRAEDSGSVCSLMLDGTMMTMNDTELSLLDDPFIALGAATGDRDSLSEDADALLDSEPTQVDVSDSTAASVEKDNAEPTA